MPSVVLQIYINLIPPVLPVMCSVILTLFQARRDVVKVERALDRLIGAVIKTVVPGEPAMVVETQGSTTVFTAEINSASQVLDAVKPLGAGASVSLASYEQLVGGGNQNTSSREVTFSVSRL